MKINYLLLVFTLFLFACKSDNDDKVPPTPVTPDGVERILVGNEGGFMAENAELTLINRDSATAFQNIYAYYNEDEGLGDILQSMYAYNNEIYLVLNNSGKIEVIGQDDFKSKRTITGMNSPRYMLFFNGNKAYVSDLADNGIHVVNPTTGTYTSMINTGTWIEHMVEHNGEVWCTAPGTDKLYFLNINDETFSGNVTLSQGVSDIGKDKNNNFWVMSQGTWSEPYIEPAIHHIDGSSKEVLATYSFPEGTGFGGNLTMSADGENVLYLLNGKIYKMAISDTQLPSQPFIEKSGVFFYTLSVNSDSGEIALTDAVDFSQTGKVYFYNADGTAKDNYEAGVVPRSVLWF